MTRIHGLFLSMVVSAGLITPHARAAGLPVVSSASVDYAHATLTLTGQNFGSSPVVVLDGLNFPTASASTGQIVASFPTGTPPSSLVPATYFLTVAFKNQLPVIFTVDIGANGPQGTQGVAGPQGPQGPQGLQGIQGLPGAAGATGPMGAPGPMGPAGSNGAIGATGPQGAQGPPGLPGATGAQGLQGPAGTSGGLPSCAFPDFAVLYNGAFLCKSAVPRYTDNGDGTVTDNLTGLMWEQPTGACTGEVTCVNNQYTWSQTVTDSAGFQVPSSVADGTLFSDFIAGLNGGDYFNPASQQILNLAPGTPCFANHCDWRIPTYSELFSIFLLTPVCKSLSDFPCINPVLGPTQPSAYWSFSYEAISNTPFGSLAVQFNNGLNPSAISKINNLYARAVRTNK